MNAEITTIVNQKGGVGKSFSCINIGIGLARTGKKFYWSICYLQTFDYRVWK